MVVDSVSVIVPHYNRPDLVREALLSIHRQTIQPAEVLLIDDNSTAENQARLHELADLATILITPKNLGLSGARNYGAQNAKSNWLAFLDDDDCYLPNKLELQIHYLETHPEVVALGGGMTMVTPDGREEYWGGKPTRRLTLASALCYTASLAQSLLIRRDLFLELGGFDPRLRCMEDFDLGIRLLAAGHEMHFLAEPLFLYHRGGRDQLSLEWGKMFRTEFEVISRHSSLARKEFGVFGAIQLKARCYKKHGLRRGRWIGRGYWAWGCLLEAIFGRQRGEFDD